ncbi:hypothetical protein GHT07_14650 [Caenimonas koreensis DSM 17982]|uniref:Uncharacterized protein n=1 Tax=Caenimonas koreensis DSM 17982 TaxID=1121255 RepID=A0A844AWR7_9BURK|nr:hypothetical protein [Caenimonas koreensis]MRD48524.1 hypothetical protein [Caenimonas koreensis DSM 17982]
MESTPTLPPQVTAALDRGNLVEAIKLLRASGMDAPAIKQGVDAYMRRKVATPALRDAHGSHAKAVTQSQPFVPRPTDNSFAYTNPAKGLSPGQVPDSSPVWWWLVVLGIAAFIGYLITG